MHDLNLYDFYLPKALIASIPKERGQSKLMAILQNNPKPIHDHFANLINYLHKGDCLVINNTKVMKARLKAFDDQGNMYEILLSHPLGNGHWQALIKGRVLGDYLYLANQEKIVIKNKYERSYEIYADFSLDGYAEKYGEIPLPPYFKREAKDFDYDAYQTVYAKNLGAVASPTAGLHFTKEHLSSLKDYGINIAEITLHVGLGTFLPITNNDITKHNMHSEYFFASKECVNILNQTKQNHKRIIAVGTTSLRTIEQLSIWAHEKGEKYFFPCEGQTALFIKPGFTFLGCNALITNFHTPKSTLMVLVSSIVGREKILQCYEEAIAKQYRFFSYGDACFMEITS